MQVLPLTNTGSRRVTIDLADNLGTFIFVTKWNHQTETWLVDILNENDEPIFYGLTLIEGHNILRPYPLLLETFQNFYMTGPNQTETSLGVDSELVQLFDTEVPEQLEFLPPILTPLDRVIEPIEPSRTWTANFDGDSWISIPAWQPSTDNYDIEFSVEDGLQRGYIISNDIDIPATDASRWVTGTRAVPQWLHRNTVIAANAAFSNTTFNLTREAVTTGITRIGSFYYVIKESSTVSAIRRYDLNFIYTNVEIDISTELNGRQPRGLDTDGTRLLVIANSTTTPAQDAAVFRYLTDGTYDNFTFSVQAQHTGPTGIAFSGGSIYTIGGGQKALNRYDATGAFQEEIFDASSIIPGLSGDLEIHNGLVFIPNTGNDQNNIYSFVLSTGAHVGTFPVNNDPQEPRAIYVDDNVVLISGGPDTRSGGNIFEYLFPAPTQGTIRFTRRGLDVEIFINGESIGSNTLPVGTAVSPFNQIANQWALPTSIDNFIGKIYNIALTDNADPDNSRFYPNTVVTNVTPTGLNIEDQLNPSGTTDGTLMEPVANQPWIEL